MFPTNQKKLKGKGRVFICLLILAEVMALLAKKLITKVQKNPARFDKGHSLYKNVVKGYMPTCYLLFHIASKLKADR